MCVRITRLAVCVEQVINVDVCVCVLRPFVHGRTQSTLLVNALVIHAYMLESKFFTLTLVGLE